MGCARTCGHAKHTHTQTDSLPHSLTHTHAHTHTPTKFGKKSENITEGDSSCASNWKVLDEETSVSVSVSEHSHEDTHEKNGVCACGVRASFLVRAYGCVRSFTRCSHARTTK